MEVWNRTVWVVGICAALLGSAAVATAQSAGGETPQPKYQDRRFDEDWSPLRGADRAQLSPWDRIKFVPLDERQNVWMTLGGQARERSEYFNEFQLGSSTPERSGGFLLSRYRLSIDFHAGPYFRVFAEAKSALSFDRRLTGGNSASFVDELDLQNGFADVAIPLGHARVTLRGGRQELLFGAQRLVGPSDWTNIRRTFQGGSAIVDVAGWRVTPFWADLVAIDPHGFDPADGTRRLWGVYSAGPVTKTTTLDVYWLDADNKQVNFNGTAGRERRHTLGGRVTRPDAPGTVDFEIEGAGQFGTVGGQAARGWMVSANGGYTFGVRYRPRGFATFDYASGDREPGGRVGTFNQLYPTNHTYLGTTDYVGRQNIVSPSGGIVVKPVTRLSIVATQYFFWRASDRDALYDSGGNVMRVGTTTTARYIGAETDLLATYQFDRHLLAYASYNHFFPGAFIEQSGPSRASDYVYAAIQFTF